FHRIRNLRFNRTFAIDRLTERVDDAAQHRLAHRNLEELAGRPDFRPFLDLRVITENDRADFRLFEVQSQTGDAIAEIKHLVEHGVSQTFNLRHAVADFAHGAYILPRRRGLDARDLGFDVL